MKSNQLFLKLTFVMLTLVCFTLFSCKKKSTSSVVKTEEPTPDPTPDPPVTDPPNNTGFIHPGILNTQAQIDFFVEKVKAGQQPWKDAYEKLKESPYSSLSYKDLPYISVDCGSYNNPNVGCDQQVLDGMAVYCQSLMYLITKDEQYAISATKILMDWSNTYQKNTKSNSRLVVSWAAPWYTNGAEILRYNYPGWKKENTDSFNAMLDKFLPYVTDDTMSGNNWVLSSIEAHIAIAIFKSDRAMFNAAVERWKLRTKTYIFQSSDGPVPITIPGKTSAETENKWKDDATSTSYVDGMAMETCRDLGHLNLGFNSMIYAAESAWNQGTDLFSVEKKRLTDFMELHGSWMTGAVAVPKNICDGKVRITESDATGIAPPKGGGQSAWEIAYSHLHDRLRIPLPYTAEMIDHQRPRGVFKWVGKPETLTHAGWVF
nr:alginate lyase family protein [uncultured Pedobacter sp.]